MDEKMKEIRDKETLALALRDRVMEDLKQYRDDIDRIKENGPTQKEDIDIIRKCLGFTAAEIRLHQAKFLDVQDDA